MKKGLTTLLVILLAVGAMLVSCKAEVATPADELVAVSFEESASRALSATLEEFDKADFYWYYVAAKTDSTGLISGQTASYGAAGAVAVSAGNTGLSYTVPGFSQGTWKFTLYAYLDANPSDKSAWVYSGEATGVVLQKGGDNKVTVIVNPNPEGNGTLFVDMAHIRLAEASEASHNLVSPTVSVEKGGTVYVPTSGNVEYVLATGTYKVTVTYFEGSISYASGSVMATVYPGLKTTVTGYVDELITYAQFDAKQNPDIVKETWGTTKITTEASGTVALTQKAAESETNKVVSANLPATAAVDKLKELADNVGADSYATSSMKLNLSVDTSVVTETAVTYDIGMEAELTYSKNGQSSIAKSDVKNVTDYVMVEINLASDITNVSVTHSGFDMIRTDNMSKAGKDGETDPKYVDINVGTLADPLWKGFYLYDSVNKKLYIKTKSFSPFAVTLSMTDYVAVMDGTKYTSLADAVNAVDDDEPHAITLLKDFSGAGIGLFKDDGDTARNIVIDLGGHTFTCSGPAVGSKGTESQAFHLEKGNTVTIKNGKITSTSGSGVSMLVQNYCNLTLEDVTLDGAGLGDSTGRYVMSNNCGNVLITGKTNITAPSGCYAFDAYYWPSNGYPEGVSITVDTTGTITGTIQLSADSTAVAPYKNSVTIKNGTFSSCSVDISKGNLLIEGGTFYVWNPTSRLAKGYVAIEIVKDVWKVVPAVAKIGNTYYASLQDAYGAVQDEDTIVFLKDITSGLTVNNGKTFTIDLGGNEWSGYFYLKNGFVTLQNGEKTGDYAIEVATSADSSLNEGEYNKLTIGSNLTVGGNYSLILWQNSTSAAYGSLIDIEGKLTSVVFVLGNIHDGNCVINVKSGAEIEAEGIGIALNGHATVNVEKGATITSKEKSAIEVRAGNLNITGGEFTSNATPTSFEPNGSGTTTTGVAVGISQHTTKLPISVNISGGSFYGYNALWQKDVQDNGADSLAKISLIVTGGSFYSKLGADPAQAIVINDQDKLGTCQISGVKTGQWGL